MTNEQEQIWRLKAQVAALEELLTVQEAAVIAQSDRLEQSLKELRHLNEQLQAEKTRLEAINRAMVDREMKMIELKREVDQLLVEFNRDTKYHV